MTTALGIRTSNVLIPPTMADTVVRLYQEAAQDSFHGIEVTREQLLEDIGKVNARKRSKHGFIRRAQTSPGKELVMFFGTYLPYQRYTKRLIEVALPEIQERVRSTRNVRALDLGCGTGVIGLDIAQATGLRVDLVDIDQIAVACARTNSMIRGAANLINAWQSDGLSNVSGLYDVIVFNAPVPHNHDTGMISTEDYRGRSLKRVLGQLPNHLRAGGQLLLMSYEHISRYIPQNLRSTIALRFDSPENTYAIHRIMVRQ